MTTQVTLTNTTICLPEDFRPAALADLANVLWAINDLPDGQLRVVVDATKCRRAFPNCMLPLIAGVHWLRGMNIDVEMLPPSDTRTRRLFEQSNWSHYLDPRNFAKTDSLGDRHLAATLFSSYDEQSAIVHEIVDRVQCTGILNRSALNALYWSLTEITGNVLDHAHNGAAVSDQRPAGFVQLAMLPERFAFCVADCGVGIFASLSPTYQGKIKNDQEALEMVGRGGMSRSYSGQGNGISGSLRLAIAFDGQFSIVSGYATALWRPQLPIVFSELSNPFPGTVVDLQMLRSKDIDIRRVIDPDPNGNYQVYDVVEERHLADDHRSLLIKMADDTFGFGSRQSGLEMRNKLTNMLTSYPDKIIVIDWAGVDVIASSYADEFVGKLFVHVGPMTFMERCKNVGVSPLIRTLLDRAIRQRTSQAMQRGTS